jgi:uncharacterized protein (TIGR00730 family)
MNNVPSRLSARRPALCVFCGSSFGKDPIYRTTAEHMGALLAQAGCDLVFGGGGIGLMGVVARAASEGGAHVLGVIPGFLRHLEPPSKVSSEIVVTETMFERKARMFAACDGFVVLPGGLGTLDEMSEAITYAQLHLHTKPIVLVNVKGFFDPFLKLAEHVVAEGFADASIMKLIRVVESPGQAIRHFAPKPVTEPAPT